MRIEPLKDMLNGEKLRSVDVGARGGLQAHWRPFADLIAVDAFEPDAAACAAQQAKARPGETWHACALGGTSGRAKLHVLRKASSSSLFPPNPDYMRDYVHKGFGDLQKIVDVDLLSFADFLDRHRRPAPELVKLDVQGAELAILQSLRPEHWRNVLAIQTEIEFLDIYLGQPLFADVDRFLTQQGFFLFDLLPNRRYRVADAEEHYYLKKHLGIARNRRDLSARIVAGDALYFRPPSLLLKDFDRSRAMKMLLIFIIYRCLDEALWFIEAAAAAGHIAASEATALIAIVKQAAPRPSLRQRADGLGRVARKISKLLRLGRGRRAEYWLDRSWDY